MDDRIAPEAASDDWAIVRSDDARAVLHRSGLVAVATQRGQQTLWSTTAQAFEVDGPGLNHDLRGFFGYGTLRQLVTDLAAYELIESSNLRRTFNRAAHQLINGQARHILVDDLIYGDVQAMSSDIPITVLESARSRYSPEPVVTGPNTYISSFTRSIKLRLDGPTSLRLHTLLRQDTTAVSDLLLNSCYATVRIMINGAPIKATSMNSRQGTISLK